MTKKVKHRIKAGFNRPLDCRSGNVFTWDDITAAIEHVDDVTEQEIDLNAIVAAGGVAASDLDGYALASDIGAGGLAASDLTPYALASDIPSIVGLAYASDVPSVAGLAAASDVPSIAGLAFASDLAAHVADTSVHFPASDIAAGAGLVSSDLDGYVKSSDIVNITEIPWHADGSANFALTNSPQAERICLAQEPRMVKLVPSIGYNYVRLVAQQSVASASVNTPVMALKYNAVGYSSNVASFADISSPACEFSIAAVGQKDTGWLALVAGAKNADIFVALTERGGDGVADPAFGHVHVFLKT